MAIKYGIEFRADYPPEIIELYCYKNAPSWIADPNQPGFQYYTGEGRYWHLEQINSRIFGKRFAMHDWAELMLQTFCEEKYTTVTGPAAAGKTTAAAIYAWDFWASDPLNTAVIVCSTTLPGLRRRIWKEIKTFYIIAAGISETANLVDSKNAIQATKGDDSHGIFGFAVAAGNEEKSLARIIGFHPKRLLVIVDEMTDTPQSIVEACVNLDTGCDEFQFIGLGNAKSIFDPHGRMSEPANGWNSINVEHEYWRTKLGACVHLDGTKSPNIRAGKVKWPYLISQKDIDATAKDYGINSPQFWRFRRGFWPPQGLSNNIISEAMVMRFEAKRAATWNRNYIAVAGLDVGYGGDRCILRVGRYGMFDNGKTGIELTHTILIQLSADAAEPLHFQIARQVREHCKEHGVRPECFGLDSTGLGTGTADILMREWSPRIVRVDFNTRASEKSVSDTNPRPGYEEYYNRVTELWFSVRAFLENDQLRGFTDEDAVEFCARQYEMRGTLLKVENKEEMKERIGRSPDIADAVSVLVEVVRQQGVLPYASSREAPGFGRAMETAMQNARTLDFDSDPENYLHQDY